MNNCDLEKFAIRGVKINPPFRADITSYKATVPSRLTQISVDMYPVDTGASCTLLRGDGSKSVTLKDGLNSVIAEVTAEDGTVKKYVIEVTKLSASHAALHDIKLSEDLKLVPGFVSDVQEYSCTVPYYQDIISIHPSVEDSNMKIMVNGDVTIKPVSVAFGDTLVEVQVTSVDGSSSQVYSLTITRSQLPCCVRFTDLQDQMNYECPISLTALYRPVSIKGSDPKHIMSGPYMDLLTRRSKMDPFDEATLQENWRVPEYELDMKMSAANVHCCFEYRGCGNVIKLSELGHHARNCSCKPQTELDPKEVTESEWYKEDFSTTNKTEPYFKHTIQQRNWEKKLQQVSEDCHLGKLCCRAEQLIQLYKERLPKQGDVLQYKEGMSPLDALHQAAVAYASAIKLKPKDATFHFQLALVLEEHYYAAEIYGLRKQNEDDDPDFSSVKARGKDEEILAICKLHGFSGHPSFEQQLKALDAEYHQLKEQGQSSRADYIHNLYAWKSKEAGKTGAFSLDEENPLTQAYLKYQDALCLEPNNWKYNFHVGRHMLLQENKKAALALLKNALAIRPASAITRYYAGLAFIEQDEASVTGIQEAVTYLHQGLEKMLSDLFASSECTNILQADNPFCFQNPQLLGGLLKLCRLLKTTVLKPSNCIMTSQQVLHLVADWSVKALCRCPQKGEVAQQLEKVLHGSFLGLLEQLVKDAPDNDVWIKKRCQAISALLRLTSIPRCQELLDMQEKVCQLGVIASPCNSDSLYLLGVAQLAQYDNNSSSENVQLALQDAKLSFKASIYMENKPTKGPVPLEITNQKWWQEWNAAEEKKQNQLRKAEIRAAITGRSSKGRGASPAPRGANTTSRLNTVPKKITTVTQRGGFNKAVPISIARGRGAPGLSKTIMVATSRSKAPSNSTATVKVSEPHVSLADKPSESEARPVPIQDCTSVPAAVNRCSFLHRLGLARSLSRTKDTAEDAAALYQEVINMAPTVPDAYIELAELIVNTDPLAAIEGYCRYPQKPVEEQSFDDAFIPGEIIRLLIKCEKYDDPRLTGNMISYGKIMGIGCLEKYIGILEGKLKTGILKTVYAGIHNKPIDDKDLQNFFRFKCWI
ncbi:uncharacterized protein RCH25_048729 [Pelodytes ibericus]